MPSRREAGRRVLEIAQRLSDDLLDAEHQAFLAIEEVFATHVGRARYALQNMAKGRPRRLLTADKRLLMRALTDTLTDTGEPVDRLLSQVHDLTVSATTEELEVIRPFLPGEHQGQVPVAVEYMETIWPSLLEQAHDRYIEAAEIVAARQPAQWDVQIGAALSSGEGMVQIADRFLSETQLRLPANGGRGVWWRPLSAMQQMAREISIQTMNALRTEALEELNDAVR